MRTRLKEKNPPKSEPKKKGRIIQSAKARRVRSLQLKALKDHHQSSYHTLRRQALRVVGSPELADDVVQDAFTNTAAAIARGTEIKNLSCWLSRCVHNVSVSCMEHNNSKLQPLMENFDLIDPDSPPEHVYGRKRHNNDVYRAIDRLAPAQRSAILLAEFKGLKHRDIATTLGCSENSVRQLLARARKNIREAVGPDTATSLAAPVLQLEDLGFMSFKGRAHALQDYVAAKIAHFQEAVNMLVQRSAGIGSQSAAALVAGALAVVAISAPSSTTEDKSAQQVGAPTATPIQTVISPEQSVTTSPAEKSAVAELPRPVPVSPDGNWRTDNGRTDVGHRSDPDRNNGPTNPSARDSGNPDPQTDTDVGGNNEGSGSELNGPGAKVDPCAGTPQTMTGGCQSAKSPGNTYSGSPDEGPTTVMEPDPEDPCVESAIPGCPDDDPPATGMQPVTPPPENPCSTETTFGAAPTCPSDQQ